jgi:hypothetical protein
MNCWLCAARIRMTRRPDGEQARSPVAQRFAAHRGVLPRVVLAA